jgi:putative peptidoglycan lipid II flippase
VPETLRRLLDRWPRLILAGYWIALAVATHWPRLDVSGGHNDLAGGVVQVDKLLHVSAFGLLAWLLIRARPAGRGASDVANVVAATVIALVYAVIDEYTQRWVDRQVSWGDIVASHIGILIVAVLVLTPWEVPHSLPRAGRIVAARITWLLIAPTLVFFTVAPQANQVVGPILALVVEPRPGLDKALHLFFGITLTWLLAAAAPGRRHHPRLGAIITIAVMAVSAPLIEIVQYHTGRGFEVADVFFHNVGLMIGLAGWATALAAWQWIEQPVAACSPHEAAIPDAAHARPTGGGFVGHAIVVSALTFVSRITGLVRDAVLAAAFGLGPISDAFFIGFLVPNLFRRLFGEGALSAAFIPHYSELLKKDRDLARGFATLCLTLLTVVLMAFTLIGELLLWLVLRSRRWGEHTLLAIELTMLMLPYMPLICLVALIGGVLQVHRRFGAPAAAPVVLNVVMILAAVWATWDLSLGSAGAGGDGDAVELRWAVVVVSFSVLVAGVLQLAWQAAAMFGVAPPRFRFAGTGPTLRSMLVMMLPMLIGLAVFQINAFMDSAIAFALSNRGDEDQQLRILGRSVDYPMSAGAVAALQWSQRLYQFPLGVFGIAIATAIFPALAAAAPRGDADGDTRGGVAALREEFARILRQGLRLTMFIGLPAGVGIILLRLPIARAVYERGAFTFDDAERVAFILAGYSASIWAYSMTHVLTRAFYAFKDARTPLKISVVMVGFNLTLNLILIWPLGAAGLAWSTAISAAGQVVLLLLAIRRKVESPVDGYVLRGWGRTAALTLAMAAVLGPAVWLIDIPSLDRLSSALWLAVLVVIGAAICLGGAWATGAEELAWLKRRRRDGS